MPITTLTYTDRERFDPTTDVIVNTSRYPFNDGAPMWDKAVLRTTHRGRVVRTGEMNGYDDSDFYAVVEDEGMPGTFDKVVYASTRFWTYGNSATVDATDDVLDRYREHRRRAAEHLQTMQDDYDAKVANVDDRVTIIKPITRGENAVEAGTTGTVGWVGVNPFRSSRWATVPRLRVDLDDGRHVFVDADRTDKPNPDDPNVGRRFAGAVL